MKKHYMSLAVVTALVLIISVYLIYPLTFLASESADNIGSIDVRNGNTGNSFTVTEREDIHYIVENIKAYTFEKDGISLGHSGTLYTLSFYDKAGGLISEFIVNSADTIRKDPFFYRIDSEGLQGVIDYLQNLENASVK